MKKSLLLALMLFVSNIVFSQRASYTEQITLAEQSIDLSQWNTNYQDLYKVQESRIVNKYAPQLATIINNEVTNQSQSENLIYDALRPNLMSGYRSYFIDILAGIYFSDGTIKTLIRKPKIRQLLFNKGCDILCDLVALYPKDYKNRLVKEIQGWQNDLNKFQMPQGKLIERKGIDEYDGHTRLYNSKGEEVENFWLRRIYFDKIPYEELKSMLDTLLTRVQAVDVSNNDDMMACYKINNEIAYCQGTEECYFLPCNGSQIERPLSVLIWNTPTLTYNGLYLLTVDNDYPLTRHFWGKLGNDEFYCTSITINNDATIKKLEGTYYPHNSK